MNKKELRINIKIDGRSYPLNINRADEEKYRVAAKTVNEMVSRFREQFQDQDTRDILAMAAFQVALRHEEIKSRYENTHFIDELKNLNDDISDFLSEKSKK